MVETWSGIEPAVLERIDARQERINRLRPWPARAFSRLWEGLLPEWIAGSVALDGNRMGLAEVEALLREGGTFPPFTLREHLEVLNHRQVIALIQRLAGTRRPIRAATVRRLHSVLFAGIDDAIAGQYRRYVLEATDGAGSAADLMRQWELWMAGSSQALHPLERAVVAHHRLLRIQPFLDGNGILARLVMNLSLLRDLYTPVILHYEDRHDYREGLYQADNGDYRPLIRLVGNAMERVQTMYLLVLE